MISAELALSQVGLKPLVFVTSRGTSLAPIEQEAQFVRASEVAGVPAAQAKQQIGRPAYGVVDQFVMTYDAQTPPLVYLDSEKLLLSLGFESNELIRWMNVLLIALPFRQVAG